MTLVGFSRLALPGLAIAVPDAFVLPFNASGFRIAEFEECGITLPSSVARSVTRRQAEYLAGRRVAQAALHAAGSEANDLRIGADRAPLWPPGYLGSVSHSSNIAAAVALRHGSGVNGVGIDIEDVIGVDVIGSILQIAVNQAEQGCLAVLAERVGWQAALTVAFSAKESFFKATAATVGQIFDFDELKIIGCEPHERRLIARLQSSLAESLPAGRQFNLFYQPLRNRVVLTSCVW